MPKPSSSQIVFHLGRIDRRLLAELRGEEDEALHHHRLGAEQVMRLDEARELGQRRAIGPRQRHMRGEALAFRRQARALQRRLDLGLEMGEAIRVGDLKLPEGVTTDIDPDDRRTLIEATPAPVASTATPILVFPDAVTVASLDVLFQ